MAAGRMANPPPLPEEEEDEPEEEEVPIDDMEPDPDGDADGMDLYSAVVVAEDTIPKSIALVPANPSNPTVLGIVDPEPHISNQFYTFNRASHHLMVRCIAGGRTARAEEIRTVATPAILASWRDIFKDRPEEIAYVTGWKRVQDKLHAQIDEQGNEMLFFKNNLYQLVPFIEQWGQIVQSFHVDQELKHLEANETMDRIRQVWTVGAKYYGVPESFIRVCVSTCIGCSSSPDSGLQSVPSSKRRRFEYTESFEVAAKEVPQKLQHLAAKYKVVLCIRQKYIRYKPFLAEVKDYCCHRGGEPTGRKPGVLKRKRYMSKRCGCSFRIRAIVPIINYDEKEKTFLYQEDGVATFKLYAVHSGHEPGPHEGSARIIHRFVDPSSISEDLAMHKEVEVRQTVFRQLHELQIQMDEFEQKLGNISLDTLNILRQDLLLTTQKLRNFRSCMLLEQSVGNASLDGGLGSWGNTEKSSGDGKAIVQEDHNSQASLGISSHMLRRKPCRPPKKSLPKDDKQLDFVETAGNCCARCGSNYFHGDGSVFCKNCEVLVQQGNECSVTDGVPGLETREGLVGMQVPGYCSENDKWYEGVSCSLDAALI